MNCAMIWISAGRVKSLGITTPYRDIATGKTAVIGSHSMSHIIIVSPSNGYSGFDGIGGGRKGHIGYINRIGGSCCTAVTVALST